MGHTALEHLLLLERFDQLSRLVKRLFHTRRGNERVTHNEPQHVIVILEDRIDAVIREELRHTVEGEGLVNREIVHSNSFEAGRMSYLTPA